MIDNQKEIATGILYIIWEVLQPTQGIKPAKFK